MSDHADIVPFVIEDGLVKQGEGVRCATAIELALVAERNEARKALADYADVSGEQFDYDTLLSKYGEKARDVREYQGYARDLRARVTELEARLAEADEIIDDCWHQFAIDIRGKLSPGGLSTLEMVDDYRNSRDALEEACAVPGCGRQRTSDNRWCQECNEAAPPPPALAKEDTDE